MKQVLFILLLLSSSAFAIEDDPVIPFSTANMITKQSMIKWTPVDDVKSTCDRESRSRGNSGFGYTVQACSFWSSSGPPTCTIITKRNPTMHTLGHELRHCFQGNWHNE
jgi:hypothetical protein